MEIMINKKDKEGIIDFVNLQPFVATNIIGATTLSQLKANINSLTISLSEDFIRDLESIHTLYPNPCP